MLYEVILFLAILNIALAFGKNSSKLTIGICSKTFTELTTERNCNIMFDCVTTEDDDSDAVCGSDGNTYDNDCVFHGPACQDDLFKVHRGPCTDIYREERDCNIRMSCVTTEDDDSDAVCGSDGNTYDNSCTFHGPACDNDLYIAKLGPCNSAVVLSSTFIISIISIVATLIQD